VLTFGLHVVFFQFFVGLPVELRAHGISMREYGALIAINPVLVVLLQIPAGELIASRRRANVLALASLLLGIGFGCMAWSGSMPAYVTGIVLFTLGEILFAPASVAVVADMAPPELRGRYQGVFALSFTAAFAAAPALGGYVMTAAGSFWLWMGCLAMGGLVALGFLRLMRS
jgi:MFS family permease